MHAHLFNSLHLLYTDPRCNVQDSFLSSQKAAKLIGIRVLDPMYVCKLTSSADCKEVDWNASVCLSTFSPMRVIIFIAHYFGVTYVWVSTYQDIQPHRYLFTRIFSSSDTVRSQRKPLLWMCCDENSLHRTGFFARSAVVVSILLDGRLICPRIHRSRSSSYLTLTYDFVVNFVSLAATQAFKRVFLIKLTSLYRTRPLDKVLIIRTTISVKTSSSWSILVDSHVPHQCLPNFKAT